MTRLALPFCTLLIGCLSADLTSTDASSSKGDGEEDYAEDVFQPTLNVYCEDDDASWCTTFTYDGSDFTVPDAEVEAWYWELDGESYEGSQFTHTFSISDAEAVHEFSGKVQVTDSSGNTHTAHLSVTATILDEEEEELSDPDLFWFNGIKQADDVGYGCYQGIVAIGGCVQSNFAMGWQDRASGDDTALYEQINGSYQVLSPQFLTHHLIGPNEMRFRLFLPTPSGTVQVTKLDNNQLIEHDSTCMPPGSGQ